MEYTEILYLVAYAEAKDSIGNVLPQTETLKKIYAKKNKVGTQEFYNAVAVGITPTNEFQIKTLNYNNEKEVNYNNVRYVIVRTIPISKSDTVLVLAKKQGAK